MIFFEKYVLDKFNSSPLSDKFTYRGQVIFFTAEPKANEHKNIQFYFMYTMIIS